MPPFDAAVMIWRVRVRAPCPQVFEQALKAPQGETLQCVTGDAVVVVGGGVGGGVGCTSTRVIILNRPGLWSFLHAFLAENACDSLRVGTLKKR